MKFVENKKLQEDIPEMYLPQKNKLLKEKPCDNFQIKLASVQEYRKYCAMTTHLCKLELCKLSQSG
jgi:hypothetical protein